MTSGLTIVPNSQPIGLVANPARRGACPSLREPMQTGDGLLARIRVSGACLSPRQLAELANLASVHGNGLIEISARGNLQVRGLTETSAGPFADAVARLVEVETGLVADVSPLAGMDPQELADPRPVAEAIRCGAAAMTGRLGPKVSVVIDSGGQISLAGFKADIRLTALPDQSWAIILGGSKPQTTDAEGAVATALAVLGALAAIGPDARATDLFPVMPGATIAARRSGQERNRFALSNGETAAVALPFGSSRGADIIALCDATQEHGVSVMRLAPGHRLLLDNAPDALIDEAATLGFVTKANDPRRRISACIGNQGCASGRIAAREIAARLATSLPAEAHLHVSGCAKGCAHPRASDYTLVGTEDGIGLVIGGRAGDTPERFLDETRLAEIFVPHQGRT